jgi:hypothetical protein
MDDFVKTEDYEPTDPVGFGQQIIDIFGSNHDDLLSTTGNGCQYQHVLLEYPHVSLVLLQL